MPGMVILLGRFSFSGGIVAYPVVLKGNVVVSDLSTKDVVEFTCSMTLLQFLLRVKT
jgi:hypothetical protein